MIKWSFMQKNQQNYQKQICGCECMYQLKHAFLLSVDPWLCSPIWLLTVNPIVLTKIKNIIWMLDRAHSLPNV
jgi:hypothetical protein